MAPAPLTAALAVAVTWVVPAAPSIVLEEPSRLRVVNRCHEAPIWIAHEAAGGVGPGGQNARIAPGQFRDFPTPDGLHAARYWAKMGCDDKGNHCTVGGSGGPGEACERGDDYSACAPPIDTKLEATFGDRSRPCREDDQSGCDFVDVSLVDGFTLPFRLETRGPWCDRKTSVIDCSSLSYSKCPAGERTTGARVLDLRATNPRTGKVAGCYSPCSKLTMNFWGNDVVGGRDDKRAAPFCCPSPPVSPEACRTGPIERTAFVNSVRTWCPGVYSYAYDDRQGLFKCAPTTQYELSFYCPEDVQLETVSQAGGGATGFAFWSDLPIVLVALAVGLVAAACWSRFGGVPTTQPLYMPAPTSTSPRNWSREVSPPVPFIHGPRGSPRSLMQCRDGPAQHSNSRFGFCCSSK